MIIRPKGGFSRLHMPDEATDSTTCIRLKERLPYEDVQM
jgi:hypothetical protein